MTPRFFTEETKSTSEFPIHIEEGRGKLTDNLCNFSSIDSVLLSFNWSLLCVIHNVCDTVLHDFNCCWIWSGTVSLYNWSSSANAWSWIECFLISLNSGCVYKAKGTGPKTETWGTPKQREALSHLRPSCCNGIWEKAKGSSYHKFPLLTKRGLCASVWWKFHLFWWRNDWRQSVNSVDISVCKEK